jgi:hypothetical protein
MGKLIYEHERPLPNYGTSTRTFMDVGERVYVSDDLITVRVWEERAFHPSDKDGQPRRDTIWTKGRAKKYILSRRNDQLNLYFRSHRGELRNITHNGYIPFLSERAREAVASLLRDWFPDTPDTDDSGLVWRHDRSSQVTTQILYNAYPVLQLTPDVTRLAWAVDTLKPFTAALRSKDLRTFNRRVLGARFTSKSFVRAASTALGNSRVESFLTARMLRGLIPDQHLATVISDAQPGTWLRFDPWDDLGLSQELQNREFYEQFTPRRIMRLLTEEVRAEVPTDTIMMWRRLQGYIGTDGFDNIYDVTRARTWEEMHDRLLQNSHALDEFIAERRRALWQQDQIEREQARQAELAKPIPAESYKDIDCATFGDDYIIVRPMTGQHLVEWGDRKEGLDHCIGSYVDRAHKGDVFLAVYKDDKLIATAHLADEDYYYAGGGLLQFYGKHNSNVPVDIARGFIETLYEYDLLNTQQKEAAIDRWC